MSTVVTRIAPSPTGRLHIGTARTALFNYLFAKRHGGTFILRSEDTDRERSTKEYEDEILEGLAWLGLSWDRFFRQSEHAKRHQELLKDLVRKGSAYLSKEPAKEDPSREVEVVRLKNPGKSVTFHDEVRGDITFDTAELGDFVIARAIDDPLYHFAVVADDADEGVTHVIRGEDHISNTQRHILIQEALGVSRPMYAHLPLILDEKRAKLSKRSGATSVMDYRAEGFLPEALVNYLALLGWSPRDDREDFSLAELCNAFSLDGIQKGGAAWNREKLLSVNQRSMRKLGDEAFVMRGKLTAPDPARLRRAVPLLKERAQTFREAQDILENELPYLFTPPVIARDRLLAKELPERPGGAREHLRKIADLLETIPSELSPEDAKTALMPLAEAEEEKGKGGRGAVLWPLRYALSGHDRSPDPFTLIGILGRDEALARVRTALGILGE